MAPGAQRATGLLRGLLRAHQKFDTTCSSLAASTSQLTGWGVQNSSSSGNGAFQGPWPGVASACFSRAAGAAARRGFSSWEVLPSPSHTQMYSDVAMARSMLPHRSNFVPQFSPHGFQLVPETLLSPLPALQHNGAAALDAASPHHHQQSYEAQLRQYQLHQQQQMWWAGSGGSPVDSVDAQAAGNPAGAVYADSVKRKRRLKMKRHKYRKRMKKLKHQLGK